MGKYCGFIVEIILGIIAGIINFYLLFSLVNNKHDFMVKIFGSEYWDFWFYMIFILTYIAFFIILLLLTRYKLFSIVYLISAILALVIANIIISTIGPRF